MPSVGVVMFAHGAANVDWVTVWFLDWNWNATVSPTEALTLRECLMMDRIKGSGLGSPGGAERESRVTTDNDQVLGLRRNSNNGGKDSSEGREKHG